MDEAVVSVLGKLADIMANEAQFLGGVGKKVERVQRELTRIKCCLVDADLIRKGDAIVQNWLNEVRDVAYHIEDAIDTFFLKVEYRDASFLQKLKKVCNKPKELYYRHKLDNELDDIQNLLEEISKSRVTYMIRDLPLADGRRATYSKEDEAVIVGMRVHMDNLLKLLHPDQTPRRTVITIVGPAGLGKTTLAHMVYKRAKERFDYHIMLSISQHFSLTDLLRKMINKNNIYFVRENQDVEDLVNKLKKNLSSKRYMIILDDVGTSDQWNQLKNVLPDVNNGSRVLITSRSVVVSTSADSQIIAYTLNLLDERDSLDLLLQKAFPFQKPNEKYPIDLLPIASELSKKCKGLPLALEVLGGFLATKELSYPVWATVLHTSDVNVSDYMQILAISYEGMLYYLKACFQYLASFLKGYVIYAKWLIRMWIAEGFIPVNDSRSIEIMAEDCLEELAKRSMIEVLSRGAFKLIKRFQVHDILHDLALNEVGHEQFITVFSQASDDKNPNRIIRRASLQAQEQNSRFIEYVGPNTRSLFLFDTDGYFKTNIHCSNFKLLKVLEIVGEANQIEMKSLDELIHLKYLGLRNCKIKHPSFHRMRSLETLELRGTGYSECDGLWTISTLRHVLVDYGQDIREPIPKGTLISNLQTLKWYRLKRGEAICDVKLPKLRKLGIKYKYEWVSIINLLQTLPLLASLWIEGRNLPMEIVYPQALPNYQNLLSLNLKGRWPQNVNVEARLLPSHLVKLSLRYTYLNHNPMPELGKLNSLKKLCLGYHALIPHWEGSIICSNGFPALQYLIVIHENIEDLVVAQGLMPKLRYLKVFSDVKVHLPPELQHVTAERW